jgi:hypothetical protein
VSAVDLACEQVPGDPAALVLVLRLLLRDRARVGAAEILGLHEAGGGFTLRISRMARRVASISFSSASQNALSSRRCGYQTP